MHGDRYLLGIWSKINLHNNTFQSRKVTARPSYEYLNRNDYENDIYDTYDIDYDLDNATYQGNAYNTLEEEYAVRDYFNNMDASSPLNSINSFLMSTSTMSSTSTTTVKPTGRLHPRLRQIINEVKLDCLRHHERTPVLQTGKSNTISLVCGNRLNEDFVSNTISEFYTQDQ